MKSNRNPDQNRESGIARDDHALLYGLGFFETFRTSGGLVHDWERHRERLLQACARADIILPASFLANDARKMRETVQRELVAAGLSDGVFRYTITAGRPNETEGRRYTEPTERLVLRPLPPVAKSVTLRLLELRRDNGEWIPRPKSLNFANAILGANELKRRATRPDDGGLFLSREGDFVVEAVHHNVAWVRHGQLHYPEPALGPVAGTCLQWAIAEQPASFACRARLDEVINADAIVILNAVRGVVPVHQLWNTTDDVMLGEWDSAAHPVVSELRRRWEEALMETAKAVTLDTQRKYQ